MRAQGIKQKIEAPSFKPHSQKNPLSLPEVIIAEDLRVLSEMIKIITKGQIWMNTYYYCRYYIIQHRKYGWLCTTQRLYLSLGNILWSFAFYWWSNTVQLFTSQGSLSELRGPGLLMDPMGICLWHLKPESKADLSLTKFSLKKNPFYLSPHR